MARRTGGKRPYPAEVTGHGTDGWAGLAPFVILYAEITDGPDVGRPVKIKMSEADALKWAGGLVAMAGILAKRDGREAPRLEVVGGPEPEPEAEPEPYKPAGRLAELLGLTEGDSK
ncbi:hypothetical protein AB0958_21880 [Streptomyces sp. NPDC006655]|uniref:hypothetical protein n=1 Tax=Streptomyces sp. NPDC006655 TaxID=3156898 RepID=UPI003455B69B